jgi:hypothetical protein
MHDTQDWRVAIVVDPTLAPGVAANTVAALGIGLGAAAPPLGGAELADARGRRHHVVANRPVPVLQASRELLAELLRRALPPPVTAVVVPFPAYARALHVYADYVNEAPTRDLGAEPLDGLGLAGPGRWVRSLTGALKLFR